MSDAPGEKQRPVILSIVQYSDAMESGEMKGLDLVEKAKALGVDGLELRRETWPGMAAELPAVAARVKELGLVVTFGTHGLLFSEGSEREQLLKDVDSAAELGSPLFRIFSGPVPADPADPAWDAAREVVQRAADRGIVIALENYARTPGGTLKEIQTVLAAIDDPALKTNIDIGNYTGWKQDVVAAIDAIGSRAAYVHVKDPDAEGGGTMCPGEGATPMGDILAALDALPQRVIYCFEFPGGDDPDDRIRRSWEWVQKR